MSSDQEKIPVKGNEAKSGEVNPDTHESIFSEAFHVLHGIGDDLRGSVLGVFDLSHEDQAANDDIAHKGRSEADEGMAKLKKRYAASQAQRASGGSHPGASSGQSGVGTAASERQVGTGTAGDENSGWSAGPQEVQAKSGAPPADTGSGNIGERGI